MLSKPIFKQTLRANIRLWLIFTTITTVFAVVMIAVFDPGTISGVGQLVEGTPLANLLGHRTFLGMLAQTYYSLHGVILPLIFVIMTANSLIAAQVDKGSMAYLLSTPTKRSTIVRTQAAYMILMLVIMFAIVTTVGVLSIVAFQSEIEVDMGRYLLLNLGLFLLMFATSGVSFLFSCLFNLSRYSLALGAGLPLSFFLFDLMAKVDSSLEGFRYISLNTLFDTDAVISGEGYVLSFVLLFVIGVILYAVGMRIFQEKDLPL